MYIIKSLEIVKKLSGNKVFLYLFFFIVFFIVLFFLDFSLKIDYKDIVVEAHGLLMDIMLFGIILTIYDSNVDKKRRINLLKEQLDDYKGWNEKEASVRIMGIFKRLKKLGADKIDLSFSYIIDVYINDMFSCENLDISHSSITNCRLNNVKFINSKLTGTKFHFSVLSTVDFTGSSLNNVTFRNVLSFYNVNLTNTDLRNSSLIDLPYGDHVNFTGSDLEGAFVEENWFSNIKNAQVIGFEELIDKYEIYSRSDDKLFRLRKKN